MAGSIASTGSALVEHSSQYRRRRFLNWFPLGVTYALLYMGRYNLTVAKNSLGDLMTKEDFGLIFGAGTLVYAFAFLLNGPLVDRMGGRKGMLAAAAGAMAANFAMGAYLHHVIASGQATTAPLVRHRSGCEHPAAPSPSPGGGRTPNGLRPLQSKEASGPGWA
jgi:MFS family permease